MEYLRHTQVEELMFHLHKQQRPKAKQKAKLSHFDLAGEKKQRFGLLGRLTQVIQNFPFHSAFPKFWVLT